MTGTPLTQEQIDYIRRHFSDSTNQELADACGISKAAVSNVQKKYRLVKSAEHNHRMGSKAGKASAKARDYRPLEITPEAIAKRVETYKKKFREEKIRWKWGLPQLTRIKVASQPKQKRSQRSYLKSLGYILDEKNCIAYYDENTTRAVRMERGWSKRVHNYYKFLPKEAVLGNSFTISHK